MSSPDTVVVGVVSSCVLTESAVYPVQQSVTAESTVPTDPMSMPIALYPVALMSLRAGTDNVSTDDDFVTDIQTAAIDQTRRTDHVENVTVLPSLHVFLSISV